VSVHPSRFVIAMVMAMTFPVGSSQSRPKSDCYVGCDAAVKGASVVVTSLETSFLPFFVFYFFLRACFSILGTWRVVSTFVAM
jgi:hypothetical protein